MVCTSLLLLANDAQVFISVPFICVCYSYACIMDNHSVMLGISPMPLSSKNKSGLVKVPLHFNVY